MSNLFQQAFHAVTSLDGRLARSLFTVALRPGALTRSYLVGNRKPYIAPFPLFLLANVFFFALQSLAGARTFSTSLRSHLGQQDWSSVAQGLVARHLDGIHRDLAEYAPVFDQAIAVNAKSMIIVMTIPFSLLALGLFFRARLPWVGHAVFALHFYTFLLLVLCVGSAVAGVEHWVTGNELAPWLDRVLAAILLIACAVYLHVATATIYGAKGGMHVVKTLVLTAAVALIFMAYRFVLLPITLWTT